MHVLFVHPSFPAQFGHVANFLATELKWRCTFVTSTDTSNQQLPYTTLFYKVNERKPVPGYQSMETIPGLEDHMNAVYQGLRGLPDLKPDLVVGHLTFGTMLLLRNLYSCPFIGYFELLPPPFWTEAMSWRKEFPATDGVRLSNSLYHAFTYLHLHNVEACYTPTRFQLSTAPPELQYKFAVIHDGVDTDLYQPRRVERPTMFRGVNLDRDMRVVTFASRGLESLRGFDIFMKVANNIAREMNNVIFLIAGTERTYYGHERHHLPAYLTFKEWVLRQDDYDMNRFQFLGWIPKHDLATLFNLSDLHFYLTAPYMLSWSMVQAMASGCTILGSATPPVQEVLEDRVNGLMADFQDVDGLTQQALRVLKDPASFRPLGQAARTRVLERYEQRQCIQQMVRFFETVVRQGTRAV